MNTAEMAEPNPVSRLDAQRRALVRQRLRDHPELLPEVVATHYTKLATLAMQLLQAMRFGRSDLVDNFRLSMMDITRLRANGQSMEAGGKGWRLVSKLIEGNFPNWEQVVPAEGAAHRFEVSRERLLKAVRFAAAICVAKTGSLVMELHPKFIRVTASVPDVGETSADVTAEVLGGELKIGFNPLFLLSTFDVLGGEMVVGEIHNEMSPLRATDGKTVNVLMPMRVG